MLKYKFTQTRRRVVESGPAEVSGECRRHERGESTRGGISPSHKEGGRGVSPEKIFELSTYVRVF